MTTDQLNMLLDRAELEELGIAIETNNPLYLYQLLCNTNKSKRLIICRPSIEGFVFVVKRSVEIPMQP